MNISRYMNERLVKLEMDTHIDPPEEGTSIERWRQQSKEQRAKEAFGKALELYPEFALCRINLGKLYYATGQVNLAIEEYKKAIALRPDLKIAHYNLAIAHQSQKKIQDK